MFVVFIACPPSRAQARRAGLPARQALRSRREFLVFFEFPGFIGFYNPPVAKQLLTYNFMNFSSL